MMSITTNKIEELQIKIHKSLMNLVNEYTNEKRDIFLMSQYYTSNIYIPLKYDKDDVYNKVKDILDKFKIEPFFKDYKITRYLYVRNDKKYGYGIYERNVIHIKYILEDYVDCANDMDLL